MTNSRISYNCNAQAIGDVNRLKVHLQKINPVAVLIMDGLALANEIHAMLPGCIVIHRPYSPYGGDDDLVDRISPEQWLDDQLKLNAPMIWFYAGNEQGFSEKSINWYIRLVKYNASKPVPARLVIGNLSVGTPEPEQWPMADELLRLCDQNRDHIIFSCHEYACGAITAGLYGGAPNAAGVQIGVAGGKNLIPKDAWPTSIASITTFFMGRWRFMVNYCTSAKIRPPRIIITETGMDDISALEKWTVNLPKTGPYDKIRGFKTLQNYWSQVYPQWSTEAAYFEGLKWADEVIYKPLGIVEAELVFCWNQNGKWTDFDVSNATIFQKSLEDYIAKLDTKPIPVVTLPPGLPPLDTPPPEPPPPPKPIPPPIPQFDPPDTAAIRADVQTALLSMQQLRANVTSIGAQVDGIISDLQSKLEALNKAA